MSIEARIDEKNSMLDMGTLIAGSAREETPWGLHAVNPHVGHNLRGRCGCQVVVTATKGDSGVRGAKGVREREECREISRVMTWADVATRG
jgi:hypothetical protein